MDVYVRARVDSGLKKEVTATLAAMGLSISDAIRLMMLRIADEHRIPFEIKVPNKKTQEAMKEALALEPQFSSGQDLINDIEKNAS